MTQHIILTLVRSAGKHDSTHYSDWFSLQVNMTQHIILTLVQSASFCVFSTFQSNCFGGAMIPMASVNVVDVEIDPQSSGFSLIKIFTL
jgi:hypothetical protein